MFNYHLYLNPLTRKEDKITEEKSFNPQDFFTNKEKSLMKKLNYILILAICGLFASSIGAQTYVGPEKCLQCHNNAALGDMTGWRTSMHANGYSDVTDDTKTMQNHFGIVNDMDENGVDDFHDGLNFNDISGTAFDVFKPNAPILAYSAQDGYTITIGDVTSRVYLTYGGSGLYKQRTAR
jgi:hypothetical protein